MDPLQKRRLNGLLLGSSCLAVSTLLGLVPASASGVTSGTLPTGGTFKTGKGNISTSGNTTTIDQSSEKAFIDWKNFSIGANGTVLIDGPNKNAVTVNRVTGVNKTEIDGILKANDNVWLLNGNGILFGKGSIINVGSLIATTSDLGDDDFRKGKYAFKKGNNPNASVINQGTITARDGGTVILSAAHVANEGVIQANMGSVVLGGANAFTVDFKGDNLIRYQITSEVKTAPTDDKGNVDKALVSNSGRIEANGGTVLMTSRAASSVQDNVINNSGMIEATSVSAHDGEVDLDAGSDGTVTDSGRINVSGHGAGETAGNVTITGQTINLADGAHINARGTDGGGTVLIGGNFHGQGTLQQATNVTIGKATINVSATRKGDGGKVAIWSKGNTVVDGRINAQGGRLGGNGGFVETSGHDLSMSDTALVATGALKGTGGTWLLDPTDVDIENCGGSCNGSNISSTAIANSLDGGTNVTVEASGNINVDDDITGAGDIAGYYNGSGTLSLLAEGSIDINAIIENQGTGAINLVAGWDGHTGTPDSETDGSSSTSVNITAITGDTGAYGNNGGSVYIGEVSSSKGFVAVGSKGGTVTVAADDVDIGPAPHGCFTANFQIGYVGASSGGGDIDIVASGDLNIQSEHGGTSRVGNGGDTYTTPVTGNITITAGEITMNQGQAYSFGVAAIGNYGGGAVSGNINITTSGDVLMGSASSGDTRVSIGNDSAGTNKTTGNVSLNVGGNLSMYASFGGGAYIGSQSATSNIKVTVAQNITMTVGSSNNESSYVQIGNYGSSAANSVAGGNITVTSTHGNIVMTNNGYGANQIGNGPANTVSGNIVVTAKNGDIELSNTYSGTVQIGNGPAGAVPGQQVSGNVTVKATRGDITLDSEGKYSIVEIGNGPALQTSGDIAVTAGGSISLTAENKYATARIGNDGSEGAASGNITVTAGGSISLYSGQNPQSQSNYNYGYGAVAQIGNGGGGMKGNASGNIVVSGSSLSMSTNYGSAYAMIGNGDPFQANSKNAGTGGASGNITVNVTGATSIYSYSAGTRVWIGNLADGGATETGSMTLITDSLSVENSGGTDHSTLGNMIASDLTGSVTTATADQGGTGGGNVTIAITGAGTTDWGSYFISGIQVPNGNTLALITTGAMKVTSSIDNTEDGNIDLIAGWDGTTGLTANGSINVSRVLSQGAYGANGGDITVGENGDVSVGTAFGNTTVAGANVSVTSYSGQFAMIGFSGQSSGNITVDATANVTVSNPNGGFSQIGNGGQGITGNVGGNITVNAGNEVVLDAIGGDVQIGNGGANSNGNFSGNIDVTADGAVVLTGETQGGNGYAQIGNGGSGSNDGSGAGSNSGNITVQGSSITLTAGSDNDSYAQIGHGGTASNQASGSSNTGNITVTATAGDIQLTGGSSGSQNAEQNDYAQIGMGGPFSGTNATNKDTGNITVHASGNIGVTGGTDSDEQNGFAIIGDTGTAKKTGNITVSAGGNIVVQGGNSTGNPDFSGIANSFAQIGDTNSGAITGNIAVTAGGSLTIRGGDGNAGDTAWVGDTSSDSNVTGNVSITVGGTTIIDSFQVEDQAGFGDIATEATATGTTVLDTNDLATGADSFGDFGKSLASSLDNGNVTVEIEDQNADTAITGPVNYDSANTLKILAQGSLHFESSIQNSGSGSIYAVGGWDGTTLNASNFTNTGVYGNNGGLITVGDVVGNVSIGSAGGTTTFAADNIDVDAAIGRAQIGWNGAGGGNITVVAGGNVTLETANNSECESCVAQIGNGGQGITGTITGNISVTTSGGFVELQAEGTSGNPSVAEIGNMGASGASERGDITVETNGGAVTLASIGNQSFAQIGDWSIGGGAGTITSNITVDAGAVSLSANGAASSAQIGGGDYLGPASTGAIRGNITIDASTVSVVEDSAGFEEARIGNLGGGIVAGTVDVDAAGDITVSATGSGAASIGSFSSDFDADITGYDQGKASGALDVQSGGNITVSADGTNAYASIEIGGVTNGTVDVTAAGNITATATGSAGVLIGALVIDNGGATIDVTSTNGDIDVAASGTGANVQIGNDESTFDAGGNVSGNVSISAKHGNITLADDTGGISQLGNIDAANSAAGSLTITAGKAFDIDTTGATIGNTGETEAGDVSIKAATLVGDITSTIKSDLPGGNFSLVLTGNGAFTLTSDIDVDTANSLTLSDGGNVNLSTSILNSGSGDISVSSGSTLTIGGNSANGDVAVGSAGGTTTVDAGNLVISAVNGNAQIGYNADSGSTNLSARGSFNGGNVTVNVTGAVSITGSNGNFAQIGDGAFGSNAAGGNVTLAANSVSVSGQADIVGDTADIAMGTGNFGSAAHPVDLIVGDLAVSSDGGNAYIDVPNSISIGVGSDGIDLNGGDLVLSADGTVTQTRAIDAGSIDITGSSITLTDASNAVSNITLSTTGSASFYDTINLTVDGATIGGNLTLLTEGNLTFVSSVQLTNGNLLAVAGWDGTTTGTAALESTAGAYGNHNASVTVGGTHASGTVSVGSKTGATTVLTGRLLVEAVHAGAQLGYAGAGSGNIVVDALGAVGVGSSDSGAAAQIGNGGISFDGNVSGNITIDGQSLVLAATNGGLAQIGNGGVSGSGSATGDITINVSGQFEEGVIGAGQAQLGNGGVEYNGDASGDISVTAGSALLGDAGDATFVMLGNGGNLSQGNDSGNITLTTTGNITGVVQNGTAAIQIGNGGFGDNGTVTGNVTLAAGGDVDLSTKAASTTSYIQIGDGGSQGQGGASGNVNITAANVNLTTDNGGYIQIGNGGSQFNGNTSGDITVDASGNILADVDVDASYIQIGNGGFQSNGNDSGNITLTAGNDLDLETTNSGGGTASNGSYVQVGNGGDASNEDSAHGFSETGNINVHAKTIEMSAGDDISGVHIGNGGTCAGAAGASNTGCAGLSNTSTNGSIAFGGNITVVATKSLSMTASGAHTVSFIGNGGSQAASGANVSGSITDSGDIAIDAGNITLAANNTDGFALIGNFAPGESGNMTIDANTLTGDLSPSIGNDLQGGDFTVILTGNQTLAIESDASYDSNHTLSLTNGGDIDFAGSVQNAGSGAIDITSGGDILIGGNGAAGDVAVGGRGTTTLTADNITLDAVNGYAQLGYHGTHGGDISVDATGAVTLTGGNDKQHTAQIGDGSSFFAMESGGHVIITSSTIGTSGYADITGKTADITFASGDLGSSADPLQLIASSIAIQSGGGNVDVYVPDDVSIGVGSKGIDLNGGNLVLSSGGNVTQTRAIDAGSINIDGGLIVLTNANNSFGGVALTTGGDASIFDASSMTITGADVGGTLTLVSSGDIGQSGAISANVLDVTTNSGAIALTNAGNNIGSADLTSSGDASLYDASDLTIADANIGGALTLSGGGNIGQTGAITADALDVSASNVTLTDSGNTFTTATVTSSGNASLFDASGVTIASADVGGTFTLASGGNIGQSGAITAGTLDVTANHGSITLTNSSNDIADAALTTSGNASLDDGADLTIDSASVGGALKISGGGNVDQSGTIQTKTLSVTANGAIALTNAHNAITSATLSAGGNAALYDSKSLTVDGASAGGNLTLLTEGNLTFVKSVQVNNGDLIAVAGWDGTTTSASGLTHSGAYGNNGGSIIVGGSNAAGDVAVGSRHGSTTLAGADVSLEADNGYAQIGYHGSGSGSIDVVATGNVTLGGGTQAGAFAQIGNGGEGISGNESGDITVDAGGNVSLDGGNGTDAYAQIGHGGAHDDKNSQGYTNSGNITVNGKNVELVAGHGDESYAQIGNGGFDLGDGLSGQGVNEGDINVTASDSVRLSGGDGNDAYSQIGNGGDQSNKNPSASAGGSDAGNVTVTANNGTVDLASGSGTNAYTQIGNGGFDVNDGAAAEAASFTISGAINVSDLTITGSDTGTDAYSQVGNGDASQNSVADVSGNITIDAGSITVTSGKADGATAMIGNATGKGTVSGTITGYTPPGQNNDNSNQGVIQSTQSTSTQANTQQVNLIVTNPPINPNEGGNNDNNNGSQGGPLGDLSNNQEASGDQASDDATDALGNSLGGHKNVQTVSLIPGVLTQVVAMQTPHGIPPADQDISNWGNEALWRW